MKVHVVSKEENIIYDKGKSYLIVSKKQGTTRIRIDDILYFEKELRLIHVRTKDYTYSFYGSFKMLNKVIDSSFCRCHNSIFVNMNRIIHIQRYELYLDNGETLDISQRKYSYTKKCFINYLKENSSCIIKGDIV